MRMFDAATTFGYSNLIYENASKCWRESDSLTNPELDFSNLIPFCHNAPMLPRKGGELNLKKVPLMEMEGRIKLRGRTFHKVVQSGTTDD